MTHQRLTSMGKPGSLQDRFDCALKTVGTQMVDRLRPLQFRLQAVRKSPRSNLPQHIAGLFLFPVSQLLNLFLKLRRAAVYRRMYHRYMIDLAVFRTDRSWSGRREQEVDRYKRVWAGPEDGWIGPPTRSMIQGALDAAQISQVHGAHLIGVEPQSMRRWIQGTREMPFSAWHTLLTRSGLHPDCDRPW